MDEKDKIKQMTENRQNSSFYKKPASFCLSMANNKQGGEGCLLTEIELGTGE